MGVHSAPRSRLLFAVLFLAVILGLGGLNARYLFRTELHEHGDLASNSLAIREAKTFHRLTGQYSRWGFSHPGPGWFYAEAAGEGLFHDTLRLVPTPWNGQILAVLLINAAFLAAAVTTVAHQGPGRVAAPLAALFAVGHLAAIGGDGLLNLWSPYLTVPAMACFLVAAASVAAGRGEALPLAAAAGTALLHAYISQPLWVFPIFGLAYASLLWTLARPRADTPGGPRRWRFPRPWRAFPRAHVWTAGIVFLCALPVALDALRGAESNLAVILNFRREHAGEPPRPWAEGVSYVLHFLTYKPTGADGGIYRGGPAWSETVRYARSHAGVLLVWALAALTPGLATFARRRWGTGDGGPTGSPTAGRFLAALALAVVVAGTVAVHWARTQEGQMFYFTSWSNYGVLLALALLAAASLGDIAASLFPRASRSGALAVALWALAAGTFARQAGGFRATDGADESSRNLARNVDATLAEDPAGRGRVKYLAFPGDAWEDAVSVALALERRGERWQVPPDWGIIFGPAHSPAEGPFAGLRAGNELRVWHIVRRPTDRPAHPAREVLFQGGELRTASPAVDPAAGTALLFSGPQPNAADYLLAGWTTPTPGEPYTWTERSKGLMAFRAVPVPDDRAVEMVIDLFPSLTPGRVDAQGLELTLDDQPLGTWTVRTDEPLRVRIPAAVWNARPEALLVFRFPNAVSPLQLGQSNDAREIAFGFRAVRFGLVAP